MPNPGLSDEELKRTVEAVRNAGGNHTAAASVLGIDRRTVADRLKLAARRGFTGEASNMEGGAPAGFTVKRHSARFDKEGNPAGGWLISEPTKEEAWETFVAATLDVAENLKGLSRPSPAPTFCDKDLLTVIPMGDPHFGLLSWAKETGSDFDLDIAERLTFNAVDRLAAMTPATGNRIAAAISANSSLTPIAPGTPHTPAETRASTHALSD